MPRVCTRRGLPPTLTLQSLIPLVASFLLSFFNLVLRLTVVPSAWKSRSSSAMVTLLLLTLTAAFLSHPALSKILSTWSMLALPPHFSTTRPFPGRFPLGCRRYGLRPCGFLAPPPSRAHLCRVHRHKKAFDSCWVEATLVRLFDFGVTGSLWHLLANFLCGTQSLVRLGGSVSSPWVDSGIMQGRIRSPLLFDLLFDSLAVTLRSAIPGVSLATFDSFRACQLYADDLVVLTASQADLQMALDAVHGVFAGASPLVLVPPNPPPLSSVLCTAALTAVFTSVAFTYPWFSSTGIWALSSLPLSLGALTSTFSAPAWIVFFTRPMLVALVNVSLLSFSSSVFVTNVLSSSSFCLEFIG